MIDTKYIHAFDDLDNVNFKLESVMVEITEASVAYDEQLRIAEQQMFFGENAKDAYAITEGAEDNFFSLLGKKVMELAQTLRKFLEDMISFCTDRIHGIQTDKDRVNKIIKENPDLKDKIVLSLKNEECTIKDIATFEKDYLGLIDLLESGRIDEPTFADKAEKVVDKFNKSGKVIATTALTVAGLIKILPDLVDVTGKAKDSLIRVNHASEKIKNDIEKNRTLEKQGRAKAVVSAFSKFIGITSNEYSTRKNLLNKSSERLGWFAKTPLGKSTAEHQAHKYNDMLNRVNAREETNKNVKNK